MPLYEYECDEHGHRFEVIQKFSDPPIEVCPTCGSHVHKLISSPAFQFKGSGWYITDYARKDSGGGKGSSESGDKEKGDKEKGDKEKSESKDTSKTSEQASGAKKTDSTSSETKNST